MLADYRKAVRRFLREPSTYNRTLMVSWRHSVEGLDTYSIQLDESYGDNVIEALSWIPYLISFIRHDPGCSADYIYARCGDEGGTHIADIPMYLALHYLVIAGVLRCDNCFYQVPAMGSHLLYHFWPRRWWQKMWLPRKENTL